MKNEKFGLMSLTHYPTTNIGDYVQILAARQHLPRVDAYCDREKLNTYDGDEIKMIMNAWYMLNPLNWPPSDKINPLYVSIHLNSSVYKELMSEKSIAHFKKHEPIGCRDKATAELLKTNGIDAYFSGCVTLTLGKTYKRDNINNDVFIIDPLFHYFTMGEMLKQPKKLVKRLLDGRFGEYNLKSKVLHEVFTDELLAQAKYIPQIIPTVGIEENLVIADEYLNKLRNAKLVITSRIHCALPCLAMGTPVIFLNGGFGGSGGRYNSRFDGLIELFNRVDIDDASKKISYNFDFKEKIGLDTKIANKDLHVNLAAALIERCKAFAGE